MQTTGFVRPPGRVSLPVLGSAAPSPDGPQAERSGPRPVISFVSLGCAKNLVDSEKMLGQIAESGAAISADESLADTVVVNTCGFLESSRAEALDVLRDLADRKRAGRLRRIVVAGCLVQRDGVKIREWVPEVDALVGVHNRDDVVRAIWDGRDVERTVRRGSRSSHAEPALYLGDYHALGAGDPGRWNDQGRLRLTPRHYAYVRVSEGCDQKCTFCTIPAIRGPMHCKTPAELTTEGLELIADGAKELILIGQDTTSYGRDIGYDAGLAGLLRHLNSAWDAARWIRLMYVYPSVVTDALIDAIAECDRVVKYIDIPLQHIHDRVLKAMHRRVTRAQTEALLARLRQRIPGVSIRTTFIVGFPGETEAEFRELLDFVVNGFEFDAVGAFPYSLEAETPSGRMKNQIDSEIKRERYERLMLAQQEVVFARARRAIGRTFDVLVDHNDDERGAIARHAGQAPEVDSVSIVADCAIEPGTFERVTCVDTDDYDLVVRPVQRRSEAGGGRARRARPRRAARR